MDIFPVLNGEKVDLKFHGHAEVAEFLSRLHNYYDLSWPKIAQLPAINPPDEDPIPISTLAGIAKSKVVPKKWRYRFPGIGAVDNRQRISISKKDMLKARKSIRNHINQPNRAQLARYILSDLKKEGFHVDPF